MRSKKASEVAIRERAIKALLELDVSDPESAHSKADAILLDFLRDAGFPDVVLAYKTAQELCAWWACA